MSDDELYELLAPFGNSAKVVGSRRIELFDVVRNLLASTAKATEEAMLEKMRPLLVDEDENERLAGETTRVWFVRGANSVKAELRAALGIEADGEAGDATN